MILGNMALIKRGSCSFMEKAYAAEQAGAIGAIIYNSDQNDIDSSIDMINDDSGLVINIPVLWIVGKNGYMMVESMLDVSIFRILLYSHLFLRITISPIYLYRTTTRVGFRSIALPGTYGEENKQNL